MRIKAWSVVVAIAALATAGWAAGQEAQPPKAAQSVIELKLSGEEATLPEGQEDVIELKFTGEEAAPTRAKAYRYLATAEGDAGSSKASESYWIGVQLKTLDEFALAQLGLKQGVAAEDVLNDSPAAKAGVQKHDVLLKFGETPIAAPQDLVEAVGKAQDKEVELHVIRGGKQATLKVTPIKRPTPKYESIELSSEGAELRRVEAWVQRLAKPGEAEDPKAFLFMRPGVMVGERVAAAALPKDLSISIEKHGAEPAKIKVKIDDKSWETTGDKLSELPAEVRHHVPLSILSGPGVPVAQPIRVDVRTLPPASKAATPKPVPPTPAYQQQMVMPRMAVRSYREVRPGENQAIEEVQRELQELLKKVEALKTPPKPETPLEQMRREVDQLRKELDALRKASGK